MTKRFGFTLAEVLITLAIIGVVAVLTVPTLITNISNKQLETQNKRTIALLSNGFNMLKANDFVSDLSATKFMNCAGDADCIAADLKKVFHIVEDSVSGNLAILPDNYDFSGESHNIWTEGMSDKDIVYTFITNDGTIYGIEDFSSSTDPITVYADINGIKKPNKGGEDLCKYIVLSTGFVSENCAAMKTFSKTSDSGSEGGKTYIEHCIYFSESEGLCFECEEDYTLSADYTQCMLVE